MVPALISLILHKNRTKRTWVKEKDWSQWRRILRMPMKEDKG